MYDTRPKDYILEHVFLADPQNPQLASVPKMTANADNFLRLSYSCHFIEALQRLGMYPVILQHVLSLESILENKGDKASSAPATALMAAPV